MLLLWGAGGGAGASDLIIYTEHYPPHSYVDASGQVAGRSTDLVRKLMAESGLSYEIKLVPWNRAYTLATKLDNVLIYSLMQTSDRQDQFHWLMPLLETELYLYGLPELAATFTPDQLASGHIRGVCVIGDMGCVLMRELGIPAGSILETPDTPRNEDRFVENGRADVFVAQERYDLVASDSQYTARFVKLMTLPHKMRFFLAAGTQVRPDIIAALRQAEERLEAAGGK